MIADENNVRFDLLLPYHMIANEDARIELFQLLLPYHMIANESDARFDLLLPYHTIVHENEAHFGLLLAYCLIDDARRRIQVQLHCTHFKVLWLVFITIKRWTI